MEKQVQQLKLNVTNIKSSLINSNKKIAKINASKSALIRKNIEGEKRAEAEKKIEIPRIPVVSQVFGNIKGMATSFLDKVLGFLGSILIGFVVTKLPEIMEGINKVYNFVKPIWDGAIKTFSAIAGGFKFIYDNIASIFSPLEAKKELKNADDTLKQLDNDIKSSNLENDLKKSPGGDDVEGDFSDVEPDYVQTSVTPTPVTPTSPSSDSSDSSLQPLERNRGGTVENTTQPKQQPKITKTVAPSDIGKINPFRTYPKNIDLRKDQVKLYEKNVELFEKVFKDIGKGSILGGGLGDDGGGGDSEDYSGGGGDVSSFGATNSGSISGFPITSHYGQRWGRLHGGIDVGTSTGTAVAIKQSGVIAFSGISGGYGNVIDAWVPALNAQFRFAHLSKRYKRTGESFGANEVLGLTGGGAGDPGRGSSTGSHLHYEIDTTKGGSGYGGARNPQLLYNMSKNVILGKSSGKGSGKGGLGPVSDSESNVRVVYMPIEVEKMVKKPRPKSNPAVSMVNSRGRKKKVNPLHNIP